MLRRFRSWPLTLPFTAALSVAVLSLPSQAISKPPEHRADAAAVGGSAQPELAIQPSSLTPGQAVRLMVSGAPAGATDYRWDVNGSGAYTVDTGTVPVTTATFTSTGAHRVGVEIQSPAGADHADAVVNVLAAAGAGTTTSTGTTTSPGTTTSAGTSTAGTTSAGTTTEPANATKAPPGAGAAAQSAGRTGRSHRTARSRAAATPQHGVAAPAKTHVARAAGDPGVTIADFKFTPGTTTVHVGDTVTWVNNGPSQHSATANNGSFNTGVLKKGQSGSHTFAQAGTFTYFCSVHPFMHGTIVVAASTQTTGSPSTGSSGSGSQGSSGGPSSAGSGSTSGAAGSSTTPATAAPSAESTTSSSATLPMTGMSIVAAVLAGLALLGLGLAVRRLVAGR
jgi:plastocyanin